MDATKKYSGIIADYLYNDMTPEERIEFETNLLINEELAEEFKFQSDVIKTLKAIWQLEEMQSAPDLKEAERIVDEFFKEKGY